MKRFATLLFGALLLTIHSTPSTACQWPPTVCPATSGTTCDPLPPNACDTLWIDNCQNAALVPFAATGDTVRGVGGIFTAIDSITTGFGFYLQRSAPPNTPWTGADIFTGGTNMAGTLGLKLGDSVVVYGKTAEFGGGTEILSFNNNFTTPNIVVRKVNSGNPVPAFHVGTVHELNFLPVHSPTNEAEQWEGCLVRIGVTTRVVRHIGLGTTAIPGANCLVVDNAICPVGHVGACDSVLVETATLAGINAPPVGGFIASVQGVFDQRSISGQNSYEILIRKASDMVTTEPPHIVDAYCVSNDTIRVVFDKAVTASTATDPFNYSFASATSITNNGTLEADNQSVDFPIAAGVASGATEKLTVIGVEAAGTLVPMTAAESRDYVHAIQTIQTIQGPNPDSLLGTPCEDVARFLGNNNGSIGTTSPDNTVRLSYRGICIGGVGNVFYIEAPGGGLRSGLAVFAPSVPLITGHQYLVVSSLQEFPALALGISETEMIGVSYLRDEGNPGAPAAAVQTIKQVNGVTSSTKLDPLLDKCTSPSAPATAEDYEGVLVRLNNCKIGGRAPSGLTRTPGSGFTVTGPYPTCEDTIFVHATNQGLTYAATDGHIVDVIGIMHLNFGAWEIYPRSDADVIETSSLGADGTLPRAISFSLSPNPAKVARLAFGLPRDARVDLAVFDVTGRQVAVIERGMLPAGTYTRTWDGRLDGGGNASAGLYFYRLKVGNDVRTIHGVRLK